jgi:hypothetical protein
VPGEGEGNHMAGRTLVLIYFTLGEKDMKNKKARIEKHLSF